jgi:hypothetical protein
MKYKNPQKIRLETHSLCELTYKLRDVKSRIKSENCSLYLLPDDTLLCVGQRLIIRLDSDFRSPFLDQNQHVWVLDGRAAKKALYDNMPILEKNPDNLSGKERFIDVYLSSLAELLAKPRDLK